MNQIYYPVYDALIENLALEAVTNGFLVIQTKLHCSRSALSPTPLPSADIEAFNSLNAAAESAAEKLLERLDMAKVAGTRRSMLEPPASPEERLVEA